jgi:hypothetical protein
MLEHEDDETVGTTFEPSTSSADARCDNKTARARLARCLRADP